MYCSLPSKQQHIEMISVSPPWRIQKLSVGEDDGVRSKVLILLTTRQSILRATSHMKRCEYWGKSVGLIHLQTPVREASPHLPLYPLTHAAENDCLPLMLVNKVDRK